MIDKQAMVFCPIHNCGCDDLSCDGVLPVHAHEDCMEYEDGETRLRLVCFKGDILYELPSSYTKGEIDELITAYETKAAKLVERDHNEHKKGCKKVSPKPKNILGGLSQEDVAKVFGVTRQTVIRWEKEQTEDGPNNTSNPWGYYRSLRTNPELRAAFEILSNQAKAYISAKEKAKNQGQRFKMTFERFKEDWHKHNNAKI